MYGTTIPALEDKSLSLKDVAAPLEDPKKGLSILHEITFNTDTGPYMVLSY
jgi:hypothetical protein